MPLRARLDSLDGLPDSVKELYASRDGKYVLDVETVGDFALENIGGLKHTLQEWKAKHERQREKLDAFGSYTPEQVEAALAKLAEPEPTPAGDKTPWREAKTALEAKIAQLEKLAGDLEKKNEATVGQLRKQLVDNASLEAINKVGGNAKMLLPALRNIVDMRPKDGTDEWQQVILDEHKNVREDFRNGQMVPLQVTDLVAELRQDSEWSGAFPSSGASGSGSRTGTSSFPGAPHTISAQDASDHQTYLRAKEAAEKAGAELQIIE